MRILVFIIVMQHLTIKTVIGAAAGLAVVALFFWYGVPGTGVSPQGAQVIDRDQSASIPSTLGSVGLNPQDDQFTEPVPGLKVAEIIVGAGAEVQSGKSVSVHYIGRLADGTQFDSSLDRGQPLTFVYGQGQLIPGFEVGIASERVGSVLRIIIPPSLGYGTNDVKDPSSGTVIIPGNSTLTFDVEIVAVGQ